MHVNENIQSDKIIFWLKLNGVYNIIQMNTKICTTCSLQKPISEFPGRSLSCRKCYNIRRKIKRDDDDAKLETPNIQEPIKTKNQNSKVCSICHQEKSLNDYNKRFLFCKTCQYERKRKRAIPDEIISSSVDEEIVELSSDHEYGYEDDVPIEDSIENIGISKYLELQSEIESELAHKPKLGVKLPQQYVYILRSDLYKENLFKIGKHTGSKDKLRNRYHTASGDIEILRFIPVIDAHKHEKALHEILNKYRHKNLEWFEIARDDLMVIVDDYFDDLDGSYVTIFKRRLNSLFKRVIIDKNMSEVVATDMLYLTKAFKKLQLVEH